MRRGNVPTVPTTFAVVAILCLLKCTTPVDNPYETPPILELSTSILEGYAGSMLDTIEFSVKNNVDLSEIKVLPTLPSGVILDVENRIIHGVPLETANGEYFIRGRNKWGPGEDAVLKVRIAPSRPATPAWTTGLGFVSLKWSADPRAAAYSVYRKNKTALSYSELTQTTDTFYVDDNLPPGSDWAYYLCAVSEGDLKSLPGDTIQVSLPDSATPGNTPPVFYLIEDKQLNENEKLELSIAATDADGDSIQLLLSSAPAAASLADLSGGKGLFSWQPSFEDDGEHPVHVVAWDGTDSAYLDFTISVLKVNRPPVFEQLGNQTAEEGKELVMTFQASDPDGDSVVVSIDAEVLPEAAQFDDKGNGLGEFKWTPPFGTTGNYPIIVFASDGVDSSSRSITISVGDVNRPPELSPVRDTIIDEYQELRIPVVARDPDNDSITLTAEGLPPEALFADNGDATGVLRWTPNYSDSGTHENIRIVARDLTDDPLTDTASLTIRVRNVDRPPVLDSVGTKSVQELRELSFSAEAVDPDGDPVVYSITGAHANVQFDTASGYFNWKPEYNDAGAYYLTITAKAGGRFDTQSFTIFVENFDRPPVLDPVAAKSVNEGDTLRFAFSASDPDGDTILFSAPETPNRAKLDSTTGVFTWAPDHTQSGSYTIEVFAHAGEASHSQTVKILVNDVNLPPEFLGTPPATVGKANSYMYRLVTNDTDGDSIVVSLLRGPEGMALNGDTLSWRVSWTDPYQIGENDSDLEVSVEALDSRGAADTLTWKLEIVPHAWITKSLDVPDGMILCAVLDEDSLFARNLNVNATVSARLGGNDWKEVLDLGATEGFIKDVKAANGRLFVQARQGEDQIPLIVGSSPSGDSLSVEWRWLTWHPGFPREFICAMNPNGDVFSAIWRPKTQIEGEYVLAGPVGDSLIVKNGTDERFRGMVSTGENGVLIGDINSWVYEDGWHSSNLRGDLVTMNKTYPDTVYITDDATIARYRFTGEGSLQKDADIRSDVTPSQIEAATGAVGWLVADDGTLYFTEDGYVTLVEQDVPKGGELFLNVNTLRPFYGSQETLYY